MAPVAPAAPAELTAAFHSVLFSPLIELAVQFFPCRKTWIGSSWFVIPRHEYCEHWHIGSEVLQLNISRTNVSAEHISNLLLLRSFGCWVGQNRLPSRAAAEAILILLVDLVNTNWKNILSMWICCCSCWCICRGVVVFRRCGRGVLH